MLLNSRCAEFLILVCCLVILGVQRCRCWKLRHQVISEPKQWLLDHKGLYILPSFMVIIWAAVIFGSLSTNQYAELGCGTGIGFWSWTKSHKMLTLLIPWPMRLGWNVEWSYHDTWFKLYWSLVFQTLFICPKPTVHSCFVYQLYKSLDRRFQVSQELLRFSRRGSCMRATEVGCEGRDQIPASGATKMWYLQCWTCSRSTTVDLDDGRI